MMTQVTSYNDVFPVKSQHIIIVLARMCMSGLISCKLMNFDFYEAARVFKSIVLATDCGHVTELHTTCRSTLFGQV